MLKKIDQIFKENKLQVCENFRKHNIFDPNYQTNYLTTDFFPLQTGNKNESVHIGFKFKLQQQNVLSPLILLNGRIF